MTLAVSEAWDLLRFSGAFYLAKGRVVTAHPLEVERPWTSSTGSPLVARVGDWWVEDAESGWSVDPDVFAATYTCVEGDTFKKTAGAFLLELSGPLAVESLEGVSAGAEGDFLAGGPGGDVWVLPASRRSSYEVEPTPAPW